MSIIIYEFNPSRSTVSILSENMNNNNCSDKLNITQYVCYCNRNTFVIEYLSGFRFSGPLTVSYTSPPYHTQVCRSRLVTSQVFILGENKESRRILFTSLFPPPISLLSFWAVMARTLVLINSYFMLAFPQLVIKAPCKCFEGYVNSFFSALFNRKVSYLMRKPIFLRSSFIHSVP